MDVGFDTIGNATVICYDRAPVLVTDPWVVGNAYFGSWALSHEIPEEQMKAVQACAYVWFSHGHPDHLNWDSFDLVRGKNVLLPDHVGGRIHEDLVREGCQVRILRDREWLQLSDRIRVLCIADSNQDAILLVDVNGRLVVNLNDASDTGWGRFVRSEIARYPVSFLLALSGFGDADMINLHHEDGTRIPPDAEQRNPVGRGVAERLDRFGARFFVPFSSSHRYQRSDSIWASQYTTTLEDYAVGFDSRRGELLPAFIRYDCETDELTELQPRESPAMVREPAEFGDDWSEPLEPAEAEAVRRYFASIERLSTFLDFVGVRVGGRETIVELAPGKFDRGIFFDAPRGSLVTAVENQIFDDLLIGNFMKTTFVGRWPRPSLYPNFTPYVAKYADNGRARTREELRAYFRAYRRRAPADAYYHMAFDAIHAALEERGRNALRSVMPIDSEPYRFVKGIYKKVAGRVVR